MQDEIYVYNLAKDLYPEHNFGMSKIDAYGWNTDIKFDLWENKELVNVKELKIDTSYQRKNISNSAIKAIASNFDINAFDPIVVNRKTMCIIDGQHRVLAILRRGDIQFVYVRYIYLETKEDEAKAFLVYNTHANTVKIYDKYACMLRYKDPDAVAVDLLLQKYGYKITQGSARENSISCVGALLTCVNKSQTSLDKSLFFLRNLNDNTAIEKITLEATFYCCSHGIPIEKYISKIAKLGGKTAILTEYKKFVLLGNFKSGGMTIAGEALLRLINKGVRSGKQKIKDDYNK